MIHPYWAKQQPPQHLYDDIAWSKPEQRSRAGKLVIIGGNTHGFSAVASSYSDAHDAGVGEVKVLLPDQLKKIVSPSMPDAVFVPTNSSGSIAKNATPQLQVALEWADIGLCIGDIGRSSETSVVLEDMLRSGAPLVITRDAVDALKHASSVMLERESTMIVVSFAQLQKLFQAVYYPRTLLFSMQLTTLVETLHKFTITYPTTIVTFHHQQIIIAREGIVTTTPWENPMSLWRGTTATKAAVYWLWNLGRPLEAATTSLI